MTVSAVRPWRTALGSERRFPASVFGPVLLSALRRWASIWLRICPESVARSHDEFGAMV